MAVFCLPDAQWWSKRTNLRASGLSVHGICNGIRNLEKSSVRRVSCVDSLKVKYRHTLGGTASCSICFPYCRADVAELQGTSAIITSKLARLLCSRYRSMVCRNNFMVVLSRPDQDNHLHHHHHLLLLLHRHHYDDDYRSAVCSTKYGFVVTNCSSSSTSLQGR